MSLNRQKSPRSLPNEPSHLLHKPQFLNLSKGTLRRERTHSNFQKRILGEVQLCIRDITTKIQRQMALEIYQNPEALFLPEPQASLPLLQLVHPMDLPAIDRNLRQLLHQQVCGAHTTEPHRNHTAVKELSQLQEMDLGLLVETSLHPILLLVLLVVVESQVEVLKKPFRLHFCQKRRVCFCFNITITKSVVPDEGAR